MIAVFVSNEARLLKQLNVGNDDCGRACTIRVVHDAEGDRVQYNVLHALVVEAS